MNEEYFDSEMARQDHGNNTTYAQIGPHSPIKVPIPAGDHNPEVTVLDKRRSYDDTPPPPFNHFPIGDYLVVKRIPEEEGLVALADVAKEKSVTCEVIAVSPYATSYYSRAALAVIKAGDKILIRTHSGTDIKVDGMEYTLIMVFDVLLLLGEKLANTGAVPAK